MKSFKLSGFYVIWNAAFYRKSFDDVQEARKYRDSLKKGGDIDAEIYHRVYRTRTGEYHEGPRVIID